MASHPLQRQHPVAPALHAPRGVPRLAFQQPLSAILEGCAADIGITDHLHTRTPQNLSFAKRSGISASASGFIAAVAGWPGSDLSKMAPARRHLRLHMQRCSAIALPLSAQVSCGALFSPVEALLHKSLCSRVSPTHRHSYATATVWGPRSVNGLRRDARACRWAGANHCMPCPGRGSSHLAPSAALPAFRSLCGTSAVCN